MEELLPYKTCSWLGEGSARAASKILCLLTQGTRLLHELRERHLPEKDQSACGTDEWGGVVVEPLVAQATLNHVVLLDLNFLAHGAEWALDLIGWETASR